MTLSPRTRKILLYVSVAWFLLSAMAAIHRDRYYDPYGSQTCDFIAPYSGSRCLLHGCNPYDPVDLQAQYTAAHGNLAALDARHSWNTLLPVYPPSTFLLIAPFTVMDYPHAQWAWYYAGAALFCLALGLLGQLAPAELRWLYFLLAGVVLWNANTDFLLGPANPSALAIAFVAMAVWAFYAVELPWVGAAMLALSLAMKPHMAIAVFLFLLLRKGLRKPALLAGAIAIVLLAGASAQLQRTTGPAWREKFQHAVTSGIQPGGTNEPSPANPSAPHILNVQSIVSVFVPAPRQYNLLSFGLVGVVGVFWLAACVRSGAFGPGAEAPTPLLALAGLLCLSLLPVYHRDYDGRLLILTLPVIVALVLNRWRWAFAVWLASVPILFSQTTLHMQHYLNVRHMNALSSWQTVVYLRQGPGALLLLAILWPAVLWFTPRDPHFHGKASDL
jgi:hypothetical protein